MATPITIRYPVRPIRRSLITGQVVDLFGLSHDEPDHLIVENLDIPLEPGELVLITGASGSGKSSILRELARQLSSTDLSYLDLPDQPIVEILEGDLNERLSILAGCGLSEARLLLRTPSELSDGQRYRFRLAYALTQAQKQGSGFVVCDEFAAVLDRTLAKVLAFNLRKLVSRTGTGLICATTHDDLVDDLNPDVHIVCAGDGQVRVTRRDVKKNGSASTTDYGSVKVPLATGRISLGGITARITSPSSAKS